MAVNGWRRISIPSSRPRDEGIKSSPQSPAGKHQRLAPSTALQTLGERHDNFPLGPVSNEARSGEATGLGVPSEVSSFYIQT